LELGIELVKAAFHPTADVRPTPILQRGDGDSQFELDGILGLKVTTAVAADDFQLTIHGFDRIGGGQGTTQGIGILQKGEIVVAFLTQFRHESRIVVVEALAKVFELSATDLFIPSISQRTPTLLELGRIIFGEMVFGIALHVNYAELNISGGKQAFGDGQQTRKIILYDD
jgi:hypothetical protein